MKNIRIENLAENMMTAEAVYDRGGDIELLKAGTRLTQRHIQLLTNLRITEIRILEKTDPEYAEYVEETIARKSESSFDPSILETREELIEDLAEIDSEPYFEVINSVYNRNMEIKVLTGEANTPIDVKYEKEIGEVKNIFNAVRETDEVEVDEIRTRVKEMLPAMTNNNDVLMRLRQLKETDDYLFDHSFRVSVMAANTAKWLNYSKGDIENIALASLLYEIGNLKLPQQILKKPGSLTMAETALIEKHPQLAYHILLRTAGVNQDIKFVALQHHERLDGSGYPLRVRGPQIHEFSKIVMVCDIYDAMTHDRPHRKKYSPFETAEYILWESGKTLDMQVCYFFLKNLAEFYTGKSCILNTGEEARIIHVDVNYPTRPVLKVGDKFVDLSKDNKYKIVDFL